MPYLDLQLFCKQLPLLLSNVDEQELRALNAGLGEAHVSEQEREAVGDSRRWVCSHLLRVGSDPQCYPALVEHTAKLLHGLLQVNAKLASSLGPSSTQLLYAIRDAFARTTHHIEDNYAKRMYGSFLEDYDAQIAALEKAGALPEREAEQRRPVSDWTARTRRTEEAFRMQR